MCGAVVITGASILKITLSQVDNNNADNAGAFCVSNNSLFIVEHSLLKENKGHSVGAIVVYNSTGYLENCTLKLNQGKYAGAIGILRSELRISNTVFVQNVAQDADTDIIDFPAFSTTSMALMSINRLYTHKV